MSFFFSAARSASTRSWAELVWSAIRRRVLSKHTRNARSRASSTVFRKACKSLWCGLTKLCWLPLVSMIRPSVSGTSPLLAKKAIFCGTPSSAISISSAVRFSTRFPRASRTKKPTFTRLTSTRNGASVWAHPIHAAPIAARHTTSGSLIPVNYAPPPPWVAKPSGRNTDTSLVRACHRPIAFRGQPLHNNPHDFAT